MIRTVNIDGKEMTAVILGDTWSTDINEYRHALFEVLEAAFLNEKTLENGILSNEDLFVYTRIIRAFLTEKGGEK